MAESLEWLREHQRLILRGELDRETVGALWDARETAMAGTDIIDLTGVERVDTSGLALLLHLVHIARQGGNRVSLTGASENLVTLARLYNLPANFIPLTTTPGSF